MDNQPSTKGVDANQEDAVLQNSVEQVVTGKKSRFRRIPKGLAILAMILCLGIVGVVVGNTKGINPKPMADCEWSGIAFAYIDENEDGVFQKDEHPLPGVTFHVLDRLDQSSEVQTGISEVNGEAELFLFLFGCPQVEYEITADKPAGFRLTTAASLPSKADYGEVFQFGFAYLPGVSTVTPRPNLP